MFNHEDMKTVTQLKSLLYGN